jgi:branched-chain amino acid transport system substrate-binding protein
VHRVAAALLCAVCVLAGACAGGDAGVDPVAASSCAELLYEGEGEPDVVVVSDLPRRGIAKDGTAIMVDAIEFVLRERQFRAGELGVGYQSCNDAVGDEPYDDALCRQNARAYVETEDVVGVIGPYNSGCALAQIPILSRREAGPLAMVSPSNTFFALTRGGEAESLYPDGVRSYARIVTHDIAQGIAAAHIAKRLGARRTGLLYQESSTDPFSEALAASFRPAARALGLEVSSFRWRSRESYTALADAIARTRPDVVYLAGLTQVNANTLVRDLRRALPQRVRLIGPDSFAALDIVQELGAAGEGMLVTVPGIPAELLPRAGRRFAREFGRPLTPVLGPGALGAAEAAQATEVLLDAIARSDGTRASVVEKLFATEVTDGILGSFRIDRFGDIDPAPVGVYRFEGGKIVTDSVVRAPLGS